MTDDFTQKPDTSRNPVDQPVRKESVGQSQPGVSEPEPDSAQVRDSQQKLDGDAKRQSTAIRDSQEKTPDSSMGEQRRGGDSQPSDKRDDDQSASLHGEDASDKQAVQDDVADDMGGENGTADWNDGDNSKNVPGALHEELKVSDDSQLRRNVSDGHDERQDVSDESGEEHGVTGASEEEQQGAPNGFEIRQGASTDSQNDQDVSDNSGVEQEPAERSREKRGAFGDMKDKPHIPADSAEMKETPGQQTVQPKSVSSPSDEQAVPDGSASGHIAGDAPEDEQKKSVMSNAKKGNSDSRKHIKESGSEPSEDGRDTLVQPDMGQAAASRTNEKTEHSGKPDERPEASKDHDARQGVQYLSAQRDVSGKPDVPAQRDVSGESDVSAQQRVSNKQGVPGKEGVSDQTTEESSAHDNRTVNRGRPDVSIPYPIPSSKVTARTADEISDRSQPTLSDKPSDSSSRHVSSVISDRPLNEPPNSEAHQTPALHVPIPAPVVFKPLEVRQDSQAVATSALGSSKADKDAKPTGSKSNNMDANGSAPEDVHVGLISRDPLSARPRISSRILCLIFGMLFLAAAAAVYLLGVHTADGQSYDDLVYSTLTRSIPGWAHPVVALLSSRTMVGRYSMEAISLGIGIIAAVVVLVRKRWWLLGQMTVFVILCYGAARLKYLLGRPHLIYVASINSNTAPSGHTILAAAAAIMLLCVVPRTCRAWLALFSTIYIFVMAYSLLAGGWHRPTDVAMSILLVTGLAMLVLAFTRTSGMDNPGDRASSASVQILASLLTTSGLLLCLYGAFIIWQIEPGLAMSAMWSKSASANSALTILAGLSALGSGLLLAIRQLTASPLTKIGLVGAPPTPPNP